MIPIWENGVITIVLFSAKETAKEVSGPKEFLLLDNELDNLTDIEWPDKQE